MPALKYFVILCLIVSSAFAQKNVDQQSWGEYFKEFDVEGSFVLYDLHNNTYSFYNKENFKKQFTPASTFKIFNSLLGLETGVIPNENFVIPWDSVKRERPEWNKDTDLKTAFRNSTIWYYQELARRAGKKKMKEFVDKVGYGNKDISGGIDKFWLESTMKISPAQQIDFLVKLYKNKLPFSQRTIDIVKSIMIVEDTLGYTLRAKTGAAMYDDRSVGWYVGYLEKKNNVYFFATLITTNKTDLPAFMPSRVGITRKILKSLKLI